MQREIGNVQSAALWYQAEMNWCVVPAKADDMKRPRVSWRPEVMPWTPTEDQVRGWWKATPEANICLLTGVRSGVVVADVDPRHGGKISTLWEIGWSQKTCIARSGSGGWHVYGACPMDGLPSVAGYAPGIELKADGAVAVLPPSVHPDGGIYTWVEGHEPWSVMPAVLPESVVADIQSRRPEPIERGPVILTDDERARLSKRAPGLVAKYVERALSGMDGGRANTMKRLAYQLWSLGIDTDELVYWLLVYRQEARWFD